MKNKRILLSVIIPIYNEAETIRDLLKKVETVKLPLGVDKEIIIVDDCSNDKTREILSNINKENIKIFSHLENQGKGAALSTGYSVCSGDIIIVQDADLEYDPSEYSNLIMPIIEGKADVVYGSRFLGNGPHRIVYFWHYIGNKVLTLFSNMFSDLNLTDMETCYKVFKREIIRLIEIEEKRFGVEPEFTAKIASLAKKENIRIYEVGISYYGRTYEEGKKIGWKDAFRAALCIWKYNSSPTATVIKRFVNGILAFIIQISFLWLIVESFKLKDFTYQNAANILSIELIICVSYCINSLLKKRTKKSFYEKIIIFTKIHYWNKSFIIIRFVTFYLLRMCGVNCYLSCFIGCLIVAYNNSFGTAKKYSKSNLDICINRMSF